MPEKTLIVLDPALRRGFTAIPNAVLFAKNISMQAKCLYAALLAFAWQDDECFPGQERLASEMGCSLRTITRHLAELREAGLISWRQQGLNRPNIYFIHPLKDVKALSGADRSSMTSPDRSSVTGQDRSSVTDEEDSVEEYSRRGCTRARGDTCTMGSRVDSPGGDSNQDEDASAHPPRPVVAEAQAVLQQLSGVELPSRVMDKITTHDDDQIRRALQVVRAYASRKQISDVVGFFLTALAEGWDVGPPAGPTGDKPACGSTKENPRRLARDKPKRSYNDLYV